MKSQLLFGASSVLAALRAERRVISKLFIDQHSPSPSKSLAEKLADKLGVPIVPSLPRSSNGLVHNGLMLECQELEIGSIKSLSQVEADGVYSGIVSEKEVLHLKFTESEKGVKFPLWIALDRIQDPQNLGAIIRTCAFLGVDGIVTTLNATCPLSPTVSKASAGAMESYETLFSTRNLSTFLDNCHSHGWGILGTDLSEEEDCLDRSTSRKEPNVLDYWDVKRLPGPTIIVMGSEGSGLRRAVAKRCEFHLRIPGQKSAGELDSLNVSVASSILISSILHSQQRSS